MTTRYRLLLFCVGALILSCSRKQTATPTPAPIAASPTTTLPSASLIDQDATAFLKALRLAQGQSNEAAACPNEAVVGEASTLAPLERLALLKARLQAIQSVNDPLMLAWRVACELTIQAALRDAQADII